MFLQEYAKLIGCEVYTVDKIVNELKISLREAVKQENELFAQKYAENKSVQWFCDLNEGGKQLRGMLLLLTYYANTQNLEATKRKAVPLAVIVEFLETSLLIQDDIIDMSCKRRDKATIHEKFQTESGMGRLDAGVAAHLLGMCGISYALSLIQSYDGAIQEAFYEMLQDTIHGEALDMLAPQQDIEKGLSSDQREELISGIAIWKTAIYSFEGPMYLGYMLSGGTSRDWLQRIGRELGQTFQMQNDLKALEEFRNKTGMTDISPYRLTAANAVAFRLEEQLKTLVRQRDKSDAVHARIWEQYPYDKVEKELKSRITEQWEFISKLFNSAHNPFGNREFELLKKYIEDLFE